MAADEGDGVIDPVADVVRQPGRGVADAREEQPAGGQRGADAAQHVLLVGVVEVMQRVEDGHDIDLAEIDLVHVPLLDTDDGVILAEGAGGAVDVLLHQFDAAQAQRLRCGRPVLRPVTGFVELARREQPAEETALAAAEIEVAGLGGQQAAFEDLAKNAVGRQLAAGIVVGEMPAAAEGTAGFVEQGAQEGVLAGLGHFRAASRVTGFSWRSFRVANRRGSMARITGWPSVVRAA